MHKILIIEDNPEVRENTVEILELSGYDVLDAENGKQGVQLATAHAPDLIVCDVMMPELDGFGVLQILSRNEKTAHIPFIFLTAKSERTDFRKGMSLGADDYLTKPFDDVELLNAIELRLKKAANRTAQTATVKTAPAFFDEQDVLNFLKTLTEDKEIRGYRKKDVIFREGEYPKQVFYVKKGKIKTYKANDEGKELIMSLYKEGDFIGFLPLLQDTTYGETAVVLEDSELCSIPQHEFLELLENNPSVSQYLLKALAIELEEKEEQLIELAYNSVRKRVADALLRLEDRYSQNEAKPFTMAILRDDLASLVGTAKETVIRTLSDFKQESLIDVKGSKITILDSQKLRNMLN